MEIQKINSNIRNSKQIWTKQIEVDLGSRIQMLSDNFGVAISRGKGTNVKGKLYFFENGIWQSVSEFPYSDYPFVKYITQDKIIFVIHETHFGNYKPRMFIINKKTKVKKEIDLPKVMWDQKDYTMWKSISFFDENKAWMVGQLGHMLYFDGSTWFIKNSPLSKLKSSNIFSFDINDVSLTDYGFGWAVGRSGTILKLKNGVWEIYHSPTKKELNKVITINKSEAFIVGEKGLVLKFNGEQWKQLNVPTKENLQSLKYINTNDIWICGNSSTLIHFTGKKWESISDLNIFSDDFSDIDVIKTNDSTYSIYLIGNDGIYSNSNTYGYSFSNVTSELALQRNGIFALFFDANNDLYPDIIVKSEKGPSLFYRNNYGIRFSETDLVSNYSVSFANSFHTNDFNNDGNKDLFLINNNKSFAVLYGDGNLHFFDKSLESGINQKLLDASSFPQTIQSADFDNDGNLDLYISNFNEMDLIYCGDGAGKFSRITKHTGLNKILNHESHGIVISDFNNDNFVDIFIFYRIPTGDKFGDLFINKGNFTFEISKQNSFVSKGNPTVYSALANDFNNDGFYDLLIFINESNVHLLINDGKAHFLNYSKESGFTKNVFHPEPSNGIIAAEDINNDGFVDLFAGKEIYLNNAKCHFEKVKNIGLTFTGNPSFSDFDIDGDMDIFIGSSRTALGSGDRSALFRNNLNNNNFVKLKIVGSLSNRDAVGAKIFLYGYDKKNNLKYKTVRQNHLGGNPLSQVDPTIVHFGLPMGLEYKIKILFPTGIIKEIHSISPGSIITIYEQSFLGRQITNVFKSFSRTAKIINPPAEIFKLFIFFFLIYASIFFIKNKSYRKIILNIYAVVLFFLIYILINHLSIFFGQTIAIIYSFGLIVPLFYVYVFLYLKIIEKSKSKFISHYKLLEVIGIGGMGKVFKAIDTTNKNIVALKIINPAVIKDEENQKRLSAEGEILSSFNHPNIIKVFEVARTKDHTFIAMEFLSGGNLEDYISKNYPLDFYSAKNILIQICDGLAIIHQKGVIHRDLKSSNIMFDDNFNVRIMDFGLSKSPLVTTMTSLGTVLGTLGFVAPEQVTNIDVDHRSDIFSLGVIMYQLFTNQLPFKGENEMALIHSIFNTTPIEPMKINPSITLGMQKIILKCLEKKPNNRYNTVIEIKEELIRL